MNSIQYVITNKRIMEIRGTTHLYIGTEVLIADMTGTTLKKSFIDKMLKVGDIYITGKKQKNVVLFDIPNSEFIFNKVEKLCSSAFDTNTKKSSFYDNNHECLHCGTYFDAGKNKCPSCGAPTDKQ